MHIISIWCSASILNLSNLSDSDDDLVSLQMLFPVLIWSTSFLLSILSNRLNPVKVLVNILNPSPIEPKESDKFGTVMVV